MIRSSSLDSSVLAAGRAVSQPAVHDLAGSSPVAGQPVLAVACVPEQVRGLLIDWACSGEVPFLLCFTALELVRLLQQRVAGLMVLGEPQDAPVSETVRALRRLGARAPLVYVASRNAEERRVSCPPAGADSVLVAPLSPTEIGETLKRLWPSHAGAGDVLTVGTVCLRLDSRSRTVDGAPIELKGKRFDLLAYLIKSAGRAVPNDELALAVVGSLRGDPRRIAKEVCAIRLALGHAAVAIETCRGGYRFNASALQR